MRAAAGLLLALALPAAAADLAVVRVVRVYDGDTFFADLRCSLPVVCDAVGIRLRGIDTPERRAACPAAREQAELARLLLTEHLRVADRVTLHDVERGKYYRLVATVRADGRDVGQALVAAGLARAYAGGTRAGWCRQEDG